MVSWQPPVHRSRIGAKHLRQEVVCQDASLSTQFQNRNGVPIKLMTVADGHGGARYWLSHIGSKLACEIALHQAERKLTRKLLSHSAPTSTELAYWDKWLKHDLPGMIVKNWRNAIENDWDWYDKSPKREAEGFSPYIYGSTIGLVVLTPHWWGCTGLGDWDLVRIRSSTKSSPINAELINSEDAFSTQRESTFSICKSDAVERFAERSSLKTIDRNEPPFALVISTDGVRKSCSTDADFLTLAHYLVSEVPAPSISGECNVLDEGLDRITTEGSGDDVSVAIGIHGLLNLENTATTS